MKDKQNFNYSGIILAIFVAMFLWWLLITLRGAQNTTETFYYGAMLGILPVIGSIFGYINSNRWGGFGSSMGRATRLLSLGLFTWGVGTLIFAYYNLYLNVEVPYPSLADAAYIISWPLWAFAMVNLSRATGVRFQLKKLSGRLVFFTIPILTIIFSYYLLVIVARQGIFEISGGPFKIFFDLAYPIGDIVILTVALLVFGLSMNYLGGVLKWGIIIILAGFVLNYLGDFFFVYTTTKETYYVANWVDWIYTMAFFGLSYGVSLLDPKRISK